MSDQVRVTVDAIDGHEGLWLVWDQISADEVVTVAEREQFRLAHRAQGQRLLELDVIWKWVIRTLRTGFSARKTKEMIGDWDDVTALAAD